MRFLRTHLLTLIATFTLTLTAHALSLYVNCQVTTHPTIGAAVAKIATQNPLGPNTITVSGACHENLSITSLDNLAILAGPSGASITDTSNGTLDTIVVVDSVRFNLIGFTINGSVNCANNAVCRLFGNTIQNSQIGYGLRASRSHLDSQDDSISNNDGVGIIIANDSRALVLDDTITNNGSNGIQVVSDAFVFLSNVATTNTVSNNHGFGILARDNGNVRLQVANVTNNFLDGIRIIDESEMRTDFVSPIVNNITGNGGVGVHIGDLSHAYFANDGSVNITGNLSGTDVLCLGQFSATRNVAATGGGSTNCVEPIPDTPQSKDAPEVKDLSQPK